MNLNKSAIWKAAGLSLLIGIVVNLVLSLLGMGAADAADATGTNEGVLAGTGIVQTIVSLGLTLLYGALYGYFARREGTPVDVGNYAVGGSLSVVLMGVIMLVVAAVLALIGLSIPGIDVPDGTGATIAAFLTAAAILGLVINAVIGAIGGAIYAATHRDSVVTTTPTGY
jgi:hypothetical protein